ncbi:MAG: LPS-assembly protein LptD, partial [Halieaceae bacterium]|nr:LPS-assembly protein LptD [Halieaceae bacterium]
MTSTTSISTSEKDGLDYTQPIYLNVAENYDATVIPRYIHGRGFQLGAEFRHLSSLFSTQITGAHLSDDDGGSYSKYYDQYIDALIADGALSEGYTEEELAALDIQEDDVLPYKGE